MFGTFEGEYALGTDEEVELSRRFQRMIANFCKTGDPSLDDLAWPEYKNDTKYRMMIGLDMRVEKDPEGERNAAVMKIMDLDGSPFRSTGSEKTMIEVAEKIDPEAVEECRTVWAANQK